MNISRGKRQRSAAERAGGTGGIGGAGGGLLARRGVLGGLVALPVLAGVGAASPALAATAVRPGSAVPAGSAPAAADNLVRGAERRYNAPLLTPGTRLVLPAGVETAPVLDYYRRPHLARSASTWPYVRSADGTTVDASVIPERGAPTRVAIASGFTAGWYELIHANGRADRVTWDARKLPYLFVYGEFGGADEEPFRSQFYSLALQPMSRNPYLRSISIN